MQDSPAVREWHLAEVRAMDTMALVAKLAGAGFEVCVPALSSEIELGGGSQAAAPLFPAHVFILADLEEDAPRLAWFMANICFVTNDYNRPMLVPAALVAALQQDDSEAGHLLRSEIGAMAVDYRIEELISRFNQWLQADQNFSIRSD